MLEQLHFTLRGCLDEAIITVINGVASVVTWLQIWRFKCVCVCVDQETKDTLDKEALYRCMASCFEAAHVSVPCLIQSLFCCFVASCKWLVILFRFQNPFLQSLFADRSFPVCFDVTQLFTRIRRHSWGSRMSTIWENRSKWRVFSSVSKFSKSSVIISICVCC